MSIMAEREEVVSTINKFIKNKDINTAITLFNFLCDIKNPHNREYLINAISNNHMIMMFITEPTIEELKNVLEINTVTDKNNNTITVF